MPFAAASSPTRLGGRPVDGAGLRSAPRHVIAALLRAAARSRVARGCGRGRRRPRARELGGRPARDELAAVDDHDLVGDLLELGEDVARDQDRAALGPPGRPQEVAEPADACRVEPVGGLVEHEHLGVAEQRRGQAEPLPHPERVAAGAPPRGSLQLDELEHLLDPGRGIPAAVGEHAQVVTARAARVERRWPRARHPRAAAVVELARSGRSRTPSPSPGRADEAEHVRSVVVLPAPFGPRKPVIAPASTRKLRSSTRAGPKRLWATASGTRFRSGGSSVAHRASCPPRSASRDVDVSRARPVELAEEDPLPGAEREPAVLERDEHLRAGEHGATCATGRSPRRPRCAPSPSRRSTIRSSARSRSRATAGSACSLIVTPAVVCGT